MQERTNVQHVRDAQRGISLLMVAIGLFTLLGISALAIDLAMLYVARNEAQRAADAAVLAGAKAFVDSGYTSGLVSQAAAQNLATAQAISVGGQNKVGGQPAQILSGDVTFDFSRPGDPQITVRVQRTTARGNPLPTFFAKVFGILQGDVSALATAEAYNPSGSNGPPVGTACVKPWVLPNCDPNHSTPASPNCPGSATFVDPTTGAISNPGAFFSGGVIGAPLLLKSGDPQQAPVPSQYYPVTIAQPPDPICPACGRPGQGGGDLYRSNIECCNTNPFVCGAQGQIDLTLKPGNMQGPTQQGVSCLIHQRPGNGQDQINTSSTPFQYVAGANNPFVPPGTIITSSDSIVTLPIYDGHALNPGIGQSTATVTIVGFLQVFLTGVTAGGDVNAVILNVAGCGSSGGGSSGGGTSGAGAVTGGGNGSMVPIRLVRNPGT